MKRWVTCIFVICWCLFRRSYAFSSGAPQAQCTTMIPKHGTFRPETREIPYELTASPSKYTAGDVITVTLTKKPRKDDSYRGFLIKAVDTDERIVGTMTPGKSRFQKSMDCGFNGIQDSITHNSNVDKQSTTFTWRPTPDTVGDVTFRVTVVKNFTTFWANVDMLVLPELLDSVETTTVPTTTTTTTAATTAAETEQTEVHTTPTPLPQTTSVSQTDGTKITKPVQIEESDVITLDPVVLPDIIKVSLPSYPWLVDMNGKITFDPECGSSKGCFVKCDGENCQFMVTWRDIGTAIKFEIYGRPERAAQDAWVAVAFSMDTKMGEDSVTECVHSNGMVQAFNSYNPGYSNIRLENVNPQIGLSNIQGNYINGILMCSFERQKRVWNVPQIFDLEQDWHIMYANGRALSLPAWRISMHSLSQDNYPQTSAVMVDFQSYIVVGSGAKYPLVKAHGCLMIFAWVLFTGIGIVTARYYKNVWADKTFMKLKIWFQVHRLSMVAAVLCNALAFIIIFVEVGGYSNIPDIPGKSYLRSHPILGIIITVLSLTNPIMALFRPGPDHSKRPIFNWAHWGVGMAAYILSTICICFGFQLGKSHTPDYAIYIMIVYVIYIIVFDITLETMEILAKREKKAFPSLKFLRKGKVEQVEMSSVATNGADNAIPNGNAMSKGKVKKTDQLKTILLAVHFAFTGAFALVLVLVVALN